MCKTTIECVMRNSECGIECLNSIIYMFLALFFIYLSPRHFACKMIPPSSEGGKVKISDDGGDDGGECEYGRYDNALRGNGHRGFRFRELRDRYRVLLILLLSYL